MSIYPRRKFGAALGGGMLSDRADDCVPPTEVSLIEWKIHYHV
jgi:hypothetical protein